MDEISLPQRLMTKLLFPADYNSCHWMKEVWETQKHLAIRDHQEASWMGDVLMCQ